MSSRVWQALRDLCFSSRWNCAIFWKLNHQVPMMLTCEDAYCNNHEHQGPSENLRSSGKASDSCDGHFSNNSLELAVAKMSCHVYSLGEGIVGHVAITGKHLWISADQPAVDSYSSLKTIAVVAAVPYGVIQLGSLDSIMEDLKLVNHIRDIILELQENSAGNISRVDSSSCLSNVSCRSSASRNYHDSIRTVDENKNKEKAYIWSSVFPCLERPDYSMPGVCESLDLLESPSMERLRQINGNFISRKGESSICFRDSGVGSENYDDPSSLNIFSDKSNFHNITLHAHHCTNTLCSPSKLYETEPTIDQRGVFGVPGVSQTKTTMDSEKSLEFQTEITHMDKFDPCFKFSADCELYEALGPAFKKRKAETVVQIPDQAMCSNNFMTVKPCVELLEAVVANACGRVNNVKHENTISGSVKSIVTVDDVLECPFDDHRADCSPAYSLNHSSVVEEKTIQCFPTSGMHDGMSTKGFSSASYRKCSEHMERPRELDIIKRRRYRTGDKCKPRPRDRQLIQDRIKELRELVPDGSKCSIDSLLERTIKHMLFMQCTTKDADKLEKCFESKLFDDDLGTHGTSSYEHGSSWAMEVGDHLRVLPVLVENIDMSGQMLVKMLCEDCSSFFEIVKAIRSLGLTISKGGTEAYNGKIWMCFVVEGQKDRNMHRVDILYSLLQILQQKAYI